MRHIMSCHVMNCQFINGQNGHGKWEGVIYGEYLA
jgi:hypothetical protein